MKTHHSATGRTEKECGIRQRRQLTHWMMGLTHWIPHVRCSHMDITSRSQACLHRLLVRRNDYSSYCCTSTSYKTFWIDLSTFSMSDIASTRPRCHHGGISADRHTPCKVGFYYFKPTNRKIKMISAKYLHWIPKIPSFETSTFRYESTALPLSKSARYSISINRRAGS
jgi:hypothetical protein